MKLKILSNNLEMDGCWSLKMCNRLPLALPHSNWHRLQFQVVQNNCIRNTKEIHLIKYKGNAGLHSQWMMLVFRQVQTIPELQHSKIERCFQFQVVHNYSIQKSKEIHSINSKVKGAVTSNGWCSYCSKSNRYLIVTFESTSFPIPSCASVAPPHGLPGLINVPSPQFGDAAFEMVGRNNGALHAFKLMSMMFVIPLYNRHFSLLELNKGSSLWAIFATRPQKTGAAN